MTPEQEKQVEGIHEWHNSLLVIHGTKSFVNGKHLCRATADRELLLAIVDDLRKQLNAAVLLGQAAASLNKPMTDAEFRKACDANQFKVDKPKQYTESELREEFEKTIRPPQDAAKFKDGMYIVQHVDLQWRSWEDCARFMGAIKE